MTAASIIVAFICFTGLGARSDCPACRSLHNAMEMRKQHIYDNIKQSLGLHDLPTASADKLPMDAPFMAELMRTETTAGVMADDPVERAPPSDKAATQQIYIFARRQPSINRTIVESDTAVEFDLSRASRGLHVDRATLNVHIAHLPYKGEIHMRVFRMHKDGSRGTHAIVERRWKATGEYNEWLSLPMTRELRHWMRSAGTSHGLHVECRGTDGDNLVVMPFDHNTNQMYVSISTSERRRRSKRSTDEMDCSASSPGDKCCRYPLVIDFAAHGWHWVIAPKTFNAHMCQGACPINHLHTYTHTHFLNMAEGGNTTACCFPSAYAPLRIVYLNKEGEVIVASMPNMIAQKCGCA